MNWGKNLCIVPDERILSVAVHCTTINIKINKKHIVNEY